jgi:hypothetical protein
MVVILEVQRLAVLGHEVSFEHFIVVKACFDIRRQVFQP